MTIIYPQVHAYEANTPQPPWHSVPTWPDRVTGDEMVAAIDKLGADGAIFISAFSMHFSGQLPVLGNLDAGTALIDGHPDTGFIIDHLGIMQPRVPPAPPQPWADLPKVLELAKRPNAAIKVSGACTLPREPYPFLDIWDLLARGFDTWGFDRCL